MASVKQYINQLGNRQRGIARKLGADITQRDKADRVANLALLALLAVLIKTLVDAGVVTDAALIATLDAARDDEWPDEPIEPPPPD